ncbi:hypothetical protein [Pseudomonas sp.]|uniref:hypothetical protein n=1 Tax=Pseudomonas sp. TaxID=306 RepID=UPI0025F0D851|nr:hypothetical protein [Pseudomonas sp.]
MSTHHFAVCRLTLSRLKPVLQGIGVRCLIGGMHAVCFCRTGFSREEACVNAIKFAV